MAGGTVDKRGTWRKQGALGMLDSPLPEWEGSSETERSQWGWRRVSTALQSPSCELHRGNMCVNTWMGGWIPLMNE